MNNLFKKTIVLGLFITAFSILIPKMTYASSYHYNSGVVWHSVYAKSGSKFYVSTSNPSFSSADQSLYKGGSLGIKYALVNSSNNIVSSVSKYGTLSNAYFYLGNVSSGNYKLKFINLYDDNHTGVMFSGKFNY